MINASLEFSTFGRKRHAMGSPACRPSSPDLVSVDSFFAGHPLIACCMRSTQLTRSLSPAQPCAGYLNLNMHPILLPPPRWMSESSLTTDTPSSSFPTPSMMVSHCHVRGRVRLSRGTPKANGEEGDGGFWQELRSAGVWATDDLQAFYT